MGITNSFSFSENAERLRHSDPQLRQQAAQNLADLGQPHRTVPLLLAALRDENYEVRIAAAQSLGQWADVQAGPALAEALADPQPRVGQAAAEALGSLRDPRAIPNLRYYLNHPDEQFRAKVIVALGAVGDLETGPYLVQKLHPKQSSSLINQSIVEALGRLRDPRAIPTLRMVLDATLEVKLGSIPGFKDLTKDAGKALNVLPSVRKALGQYDEAVINQAIVALARLGDREMISSFIQRQDLSVTTVTDSSRNAAIATALCELGDTANLNSLISQPNFSGLQHKPQIHSAIMVALFRRQDDWAYQTLRNLLLQQKWNSRNFLPNDLKTHYTTWFFLRWFYEPNLSHAQLDYARNQLIGSQDYRALEPLINMLYQNTQPELRQAARDILLRFEDDRVLPALLEVLDDLDMARPEPFEPNYKPGTLALLYDPSVIDRLVLRLQNKAALNRPFAAEVLFYHIKGAEAAKPFLEVLKDENAALRYFALATLLKVSYPNMVELVLAALDDPNPYLREFAIKGLVSFDYAGIAPALFKKLDDAEHIVRLAAIQRLSQLEYPSLAEVARKWLDSKYKHERLEAVQALGKLGDQRDLKLLNILAANDYTDFADSDDPAHYAIAEAAQVAITAILQRHPVSEAQLLQTFNDPNPILRLAVLKNLIERGSPALPTLLPRAFHDRDKQVRLKAIEGLAKTFDPNAVALCQQALYQDSDSGVSFSAVYALARLQQPALAYPWLLEQLKSSVIETKTLALRAIAEVGDPSLIPLLKTIEKTDKSYYAIDHTRYDYPGQNVEERDMEYISIKKEANKAIEAIKKRYPK